MPTTATVPASRYFMLHGWARYLSRSDEHERQLAAMAKSRGTNFGIAVRDDLWALRYQRLNFRIHRAEYAVGEFGLSGMAGYDKDGWHRATDSELRQMNRDSMHRSYRSKAWKAKRQLEAAGKLWCAECENRGYHVEGDRDWPCECQAKGIIHLIQVTDAGLETIDGLH